MATSTSHKWHFVRSGGFDQVRLGSGADLEHLGELDQKLWMALSCPTSGLEFDRRTLELIDTDGDGQIRALEMLAAVRWSLKCLKQAGDLLVSRRVLPLTAINDATDEGRAMLASARRVLKARGKASDSSVDLKDVLDLKSILEASPLNGDGVIVEESTDSPALKALLGEIISCMGSEEDRSGKPGVSEATLAAFYGAGRQWSDWQRAAEADPLILVLEDQTGAAYQSVQAVKTRVDDFFARCRLAAYDARAADALNARAEDYAALSGHAISSGAEELEKLPMARVEAGRALPLRQGLNPVWLDKVAALHRDAVTPLLGEREELSEQDWAELQGKLAAYGAWLGNKAGEKVATLPLERIRALLPGLERAELELLLAADKAIAPEFQAIVELERLLRFSRDLATLLNNFISFRDFYSPDHLAIFQAGRLYMDQRSTDLCIKVTDMGKHASMANHSAAYLAYCDCVRKSSGENMTIVAVLADGSSDGMMVGRNGVFYDREGRDWDVTVVKLVPNPISIREAFWLPYKSFARMIEEQIEKFASAKEKETLDAASTRVADGVIAAGQAPEGAKKEPFDAGRFAGMLAAVGLAVGALGTAFAALLAGFFTLTWWQIPLALLGIMLAISGPSMLLAWLKLRSRGLGPLLDANGWAVNARARINVVFGRTLTQLSVLPPGSSRDLADPYAQKSRSGLWLFLMLLVVGIAAAWYFEVFAQLM